MTKNFSAFATVWGLMIAAGILFLLFSRVTVPIALFPLVFVSRPAADIIPAWLAVALWFVTWLGGLLLYEDGSLTHG